MYLCILMEVSMFKILIFDQYPSLRGLLVEELAAEGYSVLAIGDPQLILETVASFDPQLLIIEPLINGNLRGNLLEEIKHHNPRLSILIFSGYNMKLNPWGIQIDGFLMKSSDLSQLKQSIRRILSKLSLAANF